MSQVTVWRIVDQRYAESAFSGDGAKLHGGRFNSPGKPVVYTSGSLSLAVLELLVQAGKRSRLQNHVCLEARLDEALVDSLKPSALPSGWNAIPYTSVAQKVGDRWLDEGRSAVLRVPSVVIPGEYNFLINPRHADFKKIRIGKPTPVPIDARLVK